MSKLLGVEKPFQVDGLVSALNGARERDAYNALVARYNDLVEQFSHQVLRFKIAEAGRLARKAQYELVAKEAANLPSMQLTANTYKDGTRKPVARMHFEEVYRREARKLGVTEKEINRQLEA